MHNFRQMNIWIESRQLVKEVYLTTSKLPAEEKYGLVAQINRCAISVPSNIAEGSSRSTDKDFAHFLKISLGSLFELETQLLLLSDLSLIAEEQLNRLLQTVIKIQKMISNFIKVLKTKI